jgi:hypothetical protein
MRRLYFWTWAIALFGSTSAGAFGQVLWKEPAPMTTNDWVWGPGGAEIAPRPPFQFLKENPGGTNPKIDVRDAAGRTWSVKFGGEVHSDTFAARFLMATGYAAAPAYFVERGVIENVTGLKRAKPFVGRNGSFRNARFKLKQRHKQQWSWADNPFLGSREMGGLKIVTMLLSNWDTKDSRDGEGSNTGVFEPSRGEKTEPWFAVTDWGASLGKSGGFFQRDRWNWRGYREQTPRFVRLLPDGSLRWGFEGKHGADITAGVGVDDVRWLVPYLIRITDEQLTAGLLASGAPAPVAEQFTRSIRERIRQLYDVAEQWDRPKSEAK